MTTRRSPSADRQKVHDPRSPCEGSLGAVPLDILQETLVDEPQGDDEKAVNTGICSSGAISV
jgi:hypothetical protein